MMKAVSFAKSHSFGFGNLKGKNAALQSYYSQGIARSQFGVMSTYLLRKQKDSTDIANLGNIKYFAQPDVNGKVYAQDDAGRIYAETTAGHLDFSSAVRFGGVSTGGNGAGLLSDQKGRLLYINGNTNTQLGMYDGATWTDNWKTGLDAWQHMGELYEDLVVIMNKDSAAVLAADDSWNTDAFTMPSAFAGAAIRSGQNGLLMGWNKGYEGVLTLWDGIKNRSIAPWIWTEGTILAIDRYTQSSWIVLTSKQILLTTGYSTSVLFDLIDDELGYVLWNVNPKGILVVKDKLLIMQQKQSTQQVSEFARLKPGLYIFDIPSRTFEFCPISTMNTIKATPSALFKSQTYSTSIIASYRDETLAKNYIATLSADGPTQATYIAERVGSGPTDKSAEAVVLNLGLTTITAVPQALSFSISLKLFNFKRQLWGYNITNALASSADKIRVDGTSSIYSKVQVGDEVTILEGPNAGQIRHITAIDNPGASNETWTLDSALTGVTASGILMNVMPFTLIDTQTFTDLAKLKSVYFDCKSKVLGQKFLPKIVISSSTGTQVEIHDCLFVYDDKGFL